MFIFLFLFRGHRQVEVLNESIRISIEDTMPDFNIFICLCIFYLLLVNSVLIKENSKR